MRISVVRRSYTESQIIEPHLKPGGQLLELRTGARGPPVDVGRAQAGLVVREAQQRLVHRLGRQALAPPLACAPVTPLALPVHLCPAESYQRSVQLAWQVQFMPFDVAKLSSCHCSVSLA